ncbi:hypothetical protein TNCV_648711 [Trichonephila clavipes]|uniref:Uncharacterized protein n=1 Tax=Trichonephila clavipes TaxID=2585209 RepID=A0A8X6VNE3_TRICX|nr:hypothetical protein TNCV_648711 [Trichonephila clavipes]
MDVCKCVVPLRQGGTLNSRRAASLLVWLVKGEERVSRKKKLSLQEVLDLLQNLASESSDALTYDSSDEDIPANYLMEFLLNS